MARIARSQRLVLPEPFSIEQNNDWIHQIILNACRGRYLNVQGAQREHSLYGPMNTRMGWIFPAVKLFMTKPQCLLMPEVDVSDGSSEADSSNASIDAVDQDFSFDSMGGEVVSQKRDVFVQRGRKEVDFLVTKVMAHADLDQVVLVIIELKRDEFSLATAFAQISGYFLQVFARRNASDFKGQVLRGLLVLGRTCIRIEGKLAEGSSVAEMHLPDGYEGGSSDNDPCTQETDSPIVNRWLQDCARTWETVHSVPTPNLQIQETVRSRYGEIKQLGCGSAIRVTHRHLSQLDLE
ncbi:hypothetical protein D9757_007901 [Collybiopsis confluens]|uniref:Uncharacterized protein n=1 Tax=Collybiopsis confluens TaxID=2823264 RepID=A0A8H5M596_9AGAR|nr:hypothetical protein D9757_007901 [Collybiopsis confluens]